MVLILNRGTTDRLGRMVRRGGRETSAGNRGNDDVFRESRERTPGNVNKGDGLYETLREEQQKVYRRMVNVSPKMSLKWKSYFLRNQYDTF